MGSEWEDGPVVDAHHGSSLGGLVDVGERRGAEGDDGAGPEGEGLVGLVECGGGEMEYPMAWKQRMPMRTPMVLDNAATIQPIMHSTVARR